ncbi:hypothetical protein [Acinetobacter schindleri]|uniref:Uncharacterized protein n=1 Tax=Acinetobacter schindleri CIP 107287 TaxID=1217988 RepID=N8Z760_9GAMM|nr:hypothetical protein [Acinetobacter schindleri]ENV44922.1 hypothetical protein F955_01005 [Acinetobacter schindleri CIP 107287]
MGYVLQNENIGKVRINKRDVVDQIRVALWYSRIKLGLDAQLPSEIAKIIEPDKIRVVNGGVTDNDRKWRNYKNGLNVPHPKLIDKAEAAVQGSSLIINHVLWQAMKNSINLDLLLKDGIGKLSWEVQRILYKPNKYNCDRKLVESLSSKKLIQLERLASLDALAALVIFYRMGVEDTSSIVDISRAIYRTLLIICMKKPYSNFSESLILLMHSQVFSLVGPKESILGDSFKEDFLMDLQMLMTQFSKMNSEKLVTNTWKKDVRISSDFLEKVRFHNLFKESTIMTVDAI